jgi:methionyl-tRNA synthetase
MLNAAPTDWFKSGEENLKAGQVLNKAEILFTKIEDSVIEKQMSQLGNSPETAQEIEKFEEITIDDFLKVQLRTAEILSAEKVAKSDKLLKLKVNLGFEQRQVIAGIGKSFQPEDLVGKKVVMVANLKPAKLMGLESQGMLLAVEGSDGKLSLLQVDGSIKLGTRAR